MKHTFFLFILLSINTFAQLNVSNSSFNRQNIGFNSTPVSNNQPFNSNTIQTGITGQFEDTWVNTSTDGYQLGYFDVQLANETDQPMFKDGSTGNVDTPLTGPSIFFLLLLVGYAFLLCYRRVSSHNK